MSRFTPNKAKDNRILSSMEQALDKIDVSSPSSANILDDDYDDVPIKKLKTEKTNSKPPIIFIDDSEDSSSSLISYNNNQQRVPPNWLQSPPYLPQYFSPEFPKNNLLDASLYKPNPPIHHSPTYHPNFFPQFDDKSPLPPNQENSSYQPYRPGPPSSFPSQSRPQGPQIPLRNQGAMPMNNNNFEPKVIAMETEQQNKMPRSQSHVAQVLPVNELAKKAAIARKSTKGRPKEGEGTPGKGSAYIQPAQTDKLPERASPMIRSDSQKSQKDAMKSVDKTPGKPLDKKEIPQTSSPKPQNIHLSPITKPGSASKSAKKQGSGASGPSVPMFAKQRGEEVKTGGKKSEEKVIKKQRHEKNISLFQPSNNQELHELIAKELNEEDEDVIENELTLNELIVKYSNRHQNKRHASLRLHEYFELIEAPRHKPEEYPVNYKQFL